MTLYCLLFVLLHVFKTSATIQFTSQYSARTITGSVGSSVNYTWSFSGNVGGIDWGIKKTGDNELGTVLLTLDTSGNPTVTNPGYTLRVAGSRTGNSSSGQVIFTLSAITINDAKIYGCVINPNLDPLDSPKFDFVDLVVVDTPKITHPTAANADYNEGSPVNISCTATGTPTPKVRWSQNGQVKSSGFKTAHLTFNTISRADTGTYTCRANNSAGSAEKRLTLVVNYAPTIKGATPLTTKSWIGQTVTLKCEAEGVPTPTITWKKPSGVEVKKVTALENTANVVLNDQDFGQYTCEAKNSVGAATKTVQVKQIKAPGSPSITVNIQATSITVNWTAPADNGGSPITAYRVVVLRGSTEIRNENVTNHSPKKKFIDRLTKSTNYTVKVFARNFVFEGNATERKIQTKFEDVPSAVVFTYEIKDDKIILNWEEPNNNGAVITLYTVYQRIANDEQWTKSGTITDVSKREYVLKVEKGKEYEFVVTATNKYGEYPKKDNMKRVKVPGGKDPGTGAGTQSGGMSTPIIAGAAAVGVLLIVGLIIFVVWWKRRKTPLDDASSAGTALRSANEIEDGYQDVSPAAAAQGLQASGPVAEPNYAEVDVSQKKKNRRPVTDEYAQVDKSKKTKKKPKKQPGELDYAELDDLRPRPQPAPVPSGANARPVVRPPAYEGTLYADIAQFGVPQPEPTYDNMPRKDVVYSNVERAY